MYITNPMEIETKSFKIIESEMGSHNFNENELKVVMRTIHSTGDYDYKNIIRLKNNAIEAAIEAIKNGCKIVTDTRMAFSGINKAALKKANCTLDCYIDSDIVKCRALDKRITRSMAAIEVAAENGADVFVIGNAPTALCRLGELINTGQIKPKCIIGVPVGFVEAAESKEYIRSFDIPCITTEGTKGGSNVAAAIINALLYMVVNRND